ncbi:MULTISPECIES: DMT family transporter [Mangrovibacter]|uniref:Threonine/homoserine exporter RhtA n=1 Tax=Mangrovibacter plantisponsor TaxID=451513 RepID=A0A317PZV1_9ENTR|nr:MULTISPECIES: DMT family transporter [Mangrovibacter]KEA53404.1 membrane protein [Mangrovibacter sp. MFB070]PWW09200.1 drug/metabolite transporter (DMT)-like permease [Mangrovibacter plantisponsor]
MASESSAALEKTSGAPPARLVAFFLFIIPPLLWAGNFIVGRAIRNDIPPATLTFFRWLVALVVIFPFAAPFIRRDFRRYLQVPLRIIALSLSGITAFSLLVYYGLHHTSGTNALLLNSCVPILIMLFGALFYQQRLGGLQVAGIAVSFCGVLVIIFRGSLQGLMQLAFSSGDVMLLGAMASFALYTLWLRKLPAEINRMGLLWVQVLITLLVVSPLWLHEHISGLAVQWNATTLSAVLFLGVCPSFISYWFYGRCVETIGAARAGLCIHLIPVFGVVLSLVFLGEPFRLFHLAGIAAIIAGVTLASRKG